MSEIAQLSYALVQFLDKQKIAKIAPIEFVRNPDKTPFRPASAQDIPNRVQVKWQKSICQGEFNDDGYWDAKVLALGSSIKTCEMKAAEMKIRLPPCHVLALPGSSSLEVSSRCRVRPSKSPMKDKSGKTQSKQSPEEIDRQSNSNGSRSKSPAKKCDRQAVTKKRSNGKRSESSENRGLQLDSKKSSLSQSKSPRSCERQNSNSDKARESKLSGSKEKRKSETGKNPLVVKKRKTNESAKNPNSKERCLDVISKALLNNPLMSEISSKMDDRQSPSEESSLYKSSSSTHFHHSQTVTSPTIKVISSSAEPEGDSPVVLGEKVSSPADHSDLGSNNDESETCTKVLSSTPKSPKGAFTTPKFSPSLSMPKFSPFVISPLTGLNNSGDQKHPVVKKLWREEIDLNNENLNSTEEVVDSLNTSIVLDDPDESSESEHSKLSDSESSESEHSKHDLNNPDDEDGLPSFDLDHVEKSVSVCASSSDSDSEDEVAKLVHDKEILQKKVVALSTELNETKRDMMLANNLRITYKSKITQLEAKVSELESRNNALQVALVQRYTGDTSKSVKKSPSKVEKLSHKPKKSPLKSNNEKYSPKVSAGNSSKSEKKLKKLPAEVNKSPCSTKKSCFKASNEKQSLKVAAAGDTSKPETKFKQSSTKVENSPCKTKKSPGKHQKSPCKSKKSPGKVQKSLMKAERPKKSSGAKEFVLNFKDDTLSESCGKVLGHLSGRQSLPVDKKNRIDIGTTSYPLLVKREPFEKNFNRNPTNLDKITKNLTSMCWTGSERQVRNLEGGMNNRFPGAAERVQATPTKVMVILGAIKAHLENEGEKEGPSMGQSLMTCRKAIGRKLSQDSYNQTRKLKPKVAKSADVEEPEPEEDGSFEFE